MEVFSLAQAAHFLRERPIRVSVFDRPRLVCDLLCLETGQQETRPSFPASDQLYLVLQGRARVRAGPQIQELGELEAVLVPPGVEHYVANIGPGRLTAMAVVTPKPTRTSEVRVPGAGRGPGRREARPPAPQRRGRTPFRTPSRREEANAEDEEESGRRSPRRAPIGESWTGRAGAGRRGQGRADSQQTANGGRRGARGRPGSEGSSGRRGSGATQGREGMAGERRARPATRQREGQPGRRAANRSGPRTSRRR